MIAKEKEPSLEVALIYLRQCAVAGLSYNTIKGASVGWQAFLLQGVLETYCIQRLGR